MDTCLLMISRMKYIRFKCLHYNSALIDYKLDYKLTLNKDFVVGVFLSKNFTWIIYGQNTNEHSFLKGDREADRTPLLPFTVESKK